MPGFQFDAIQSFDVNLEAFLSEMDAVDAEMAAILRANLGALKSVVRNGDRNSRTRADFNASVLETLDALIADKSTDGSAP